MTGKNKMVSALIALMIGLCTLIHAVPVYAAEAFEVYIDDRADLLTDEEEAALSETMEQILPYGGAAFVTNSARASAASSSSDYAKQLCSSYFNGGSGTVFLIDMYNRRIEIWSTGKIYRTITKSRANQITSDVYTYASDGDYYGCANAAFEEMLILLEGGSLSTPLKYLTNALLAAGLSLSAVFAAAWFSRIRKMGEYVREATDDSTARAGFVHILQKRLLKKKKSAHSSGSSGGGGGFSGGGGGGGGGGGHSF